MNSNSKLLVFTADIVAAHLAINNVNMTEVPSLIRRVRGALREIATPTTKTQNAAKPAVSVRSSVKPNCIICLEDGKKLKTLKRHLATYHHMTPDDYRRKWRLESDYPMVAPNYAEVRKKIALEAGLGRKPIAEPAPEKPSSRKARKPMRRVAA
jgi:predicted transcriptional regulator